MSKKHKTSAVTASVPTMYHDLPTGRPHILIMIDVDGNISLHDNLAALERLKSFNALIKESIDQLWTDRNNFTEEVPGKILDLHAKYFGENPPNEQIIELTAQRVWDYMCKNAKSDLTSAVPVSASGRKSTILNCVYTQGEDTTGTGELKTPQALACIRLFRRCIGDQESITEAVLKQFIEDNASELRTRQDPWRIFQYYRAQLIAAKILRRK